MKAAVYTRYGPVDQVVHVEDVEKPVPKDNEVLIQVRAAGVNPLDCGLPKGGARFVTGMSKPEVTRIGVDVAGVVETLGRSVTQIQPGDAVFGLCVLAGDKSGRGALSAMGRLIAVLSWWRLASPRIVTFLAKPNKEDLLLTHDLMKRGKVKAVIDRRYRLGEVIQAMKYLEEGHARGKVVLTMT